MRARCAGLFFLALSLPAWAYTDQQAARRAFLDQVELAHETELDRLLALPDSVPISRNFLQKLGLTPGMLHHWQRPDLPEWVARTVERARKTFERPVGSPIPLPFLDRQRYQTSVTFLAGLVSDPFGIRPDWRVTNRLMGHPDNQLNELEDYLVAYYRKLGLAVTKEPFPFQGRTYHNVVVTLPGDTDETVVMIDHIDVAARYEVPDAVFNQAVTYGLGPKDIARIRGSVATGDAVPGADDNASATAALMEAAHLLKGKRLKKTIKLIHMNGEEFPGDCLGARHFAAGALSRNDPIAAVVVLDMIGVNRLRNGLFQLNTGLHPLSHRLGDLAVLASAQAAKGYRPVVRLLDDPKSYLYNTDGQVFSAAGFPTLLINEQVNYDDELERLGYHDEFDRPELINFDYATSLAQVGIQTVWQAANQEPWWGSVTQLRSELQDSSHLLTHFRIELLHSALADDLRQYLMNHPCGFSRPWIVEKVVADRNRAADESVVHRLLNFFPEGRMNRLDELAIADEMEFLLCPPNL